MKRQLASPASPKQRKALKAILLTPCLVAAGMLLLADAPAAKAQQFNDFTMVFDELVGGDSPTPTNGVYAQARFQDTGTNQVTITVTNFMQVTGSAGQGGFLKLPVITQLAFNLDPVQKVVKDPTDPSPNWILTTGNNNQGINGGGQVTQGFDLSLDTQASPTNGLPIAAGGAEVPPTVQSTRSFIVTNITAPLNSPFNAASFLATNASGLYAAAKVQGVDINGNPSGSSQIGVRRYPIPTPLPLLGAGMALAYSRRLRARINATAASGLTTNS